MSQTSTPYGLSFYNYKGGKNKMSTSTYLLAPASATSIAQGDPVNIANNAYGFISAYTAPTQPASPYFPAPSGQTLGVAVNFSWTASNGTVMNNQTYWPGGTATLNNSPVVVTVADLFSNVYRVQCSADLGLIPPSSSAAGTYGTFRNYNLIITGDYAPNAQTGTSRAALDVDSAGVTGSNYWLTCKIVGLAPAAAAGSTNSWTDDYPDVLVMINNHVLKTGTNGINV